MSDDTSKASVIQTFADGMNLARKSSGKNFKFVFLKIPTLGYRVNLSLNDECDQKISTFKKH